MDRLFVYGTLAPGRKNHGVMEHIPGSWVEASLKGNLVKDGWGSEFGYPAIVPSDEGEEVKGFLFSSEHLKDHWSMLDEFEGIGYKRVPVLIKTLDNKEIEAFVYALNQLDQNKDRRGLE